MAQLEPVTLAEMKTHLRVDHDDEDAYIQSLITAAREYVEEQTGRRLMNTTEYQYYAGWPTEMELRWSPLSSVTSIVYVDTSDTTQTCSSSVYDVDTAEVPGRVRQAYGQTWPTNRGHENDITVTYVAGYGATADSVPERAKHAIKLIAANWYEHREAATDGKAPVEVPMAATSLLWNLKVPNFCS